MALIHEKILAIQDEFPTLQKNGTGPAAQGSYKFLAVDDVLIAGRPLLNKHKVIVIPRKVKKHKVHYNTALAKDNERVARESIQTSLIYVFRLLATEDGSFQDYEIPAEGIDNQDKSTRKTVTSAQKVLYIQAFQLITGEIDPDAQDGAADAQTTPASSGASQAEAKVAKAAAPRTAAKAAPKPAASTTAKAKAEELRTAIRDKSIAVVATGAADAGTYYFKIGDRITGQSANGRTWVNDAVVLQQVLDAMNAGEVE